MRELDSGAASPIRVAVADDTRVHSQLLADALKRDRRLQVVAAVSTSRELLEIAAKTTVHVAVINCTLDEEPSRGFETLRELQNIRPVRGVILLDSSKQEMVIEAFRAGARGIFSKNESLRSLCRCVRCVYEGQIWASSRELTFTLEALRFGRPRIRAVDAKGMSLLSKRELQVVQALSAGLSNREIGESLHLSRHTIKNYLLRIFDKLGVSSRTELLSMTLSIAKSNIGNDSGSKNEDYQALGAWQRETPSRQLPAPPFKVTQIAEHRGEIARELRSAYTWCLSSEKSNLTGARDEIAALKKKLAELMSTEDLSTVQAEILNSSHAEKVFRAFPAADHIRTIHERGKAAAGD